MALSEARLTDTVSGMAQKADVTSAAGKKSLEQIDANIKRIRSLSPGDARDQLCNETEDLISALAGRGSIAIKKEKRDAVTEACTEKPLEGEVVQQWRRYEGVPELVESGTARVVSGVKAHMRSNELAKEVAAVLFDIRLRIPNRHGVPDFKAHSQDAKEAAHTLYDAAGQQLKGDVNNVAEAVDALGRAVRRQMSDLTADYVNSLDQNPAEYEARFLDVKQTYPKLSPTEAVRKHYKSLGIDLPIIGDIEKARLKRQRERELARYREDGKEPPRELLAPLPGDEPSPEEQATSMVRRMSSAVGSATPDVVAKLPAPKKKEIRQEMEQVLERAKEIIKATY
jgi:hypothetical protein